MNPHPQRKLQCALITAAALAKFNSCRIEQQHIVRISAFFAQPFAQDAVDVRLWDDLAKIAGAPTPPLAHFVVALESAQRTPVRAVG